MRKMVGTRTDSTVRAQKKNDFLEGIEQNQLVVGLFICVYHFDLF